MHQRKCFRAILLPIFALIILTATHFTLGLAIRAETNEASHDVFTSNTISAREITPSSTNSQYELYRQEQSSFNTTFESLCTKYNDIYSNSTSESAKLMLLGLACNDGKLSAAQLRMVAKRDVWVLDYIAYYGGIVIGGSGWILFLICLVSYVLLRLKKQREEKDMAKKRLEEAQKDGCVWVVPKGS
ncbi:hypothetical protein BJ508DRAFT_48235 [Ascobolus immersus RN42]|uniref:Uncharacterized protein n=1 Tax=Ascobolus immersus RN42 TaxID=1160509 RepID=A0A3N4HI29_ASCIM|nr:hypothetical protein BJ508DRAFT_48235 [Ascobolus immersus RN42]